MGLPGADAPDLAAAFDLESERAVEDELLPPAAAAAAAAPELLLLLPFRLLDPFDLLRSDFSPFFFLLLLSDLDLLLREDLLSVLPVLELCDSCRCGGEEPESPFSSSRSEDFDSLRPQPNFGILFGGCRLV